MGVIAIDCLSYFTFNRQASVLQTVCSMAKKHLHITWTSIRIRGVFEPLQMSILLKTEFLPFDEEVNSEVN